ncbi:hypothetical protein, partial [Escherichia coli]|uniref:hypothetical protein n=1 Tax=Escherichia coli TaxID=562 RepID=UPI001ABCB426
PKTSIICSPMTSLKTSIKTITYLSDTGCLEIQGASLDPIMRERLVVDNNPLLMDTVISTKLLAEENDTLKAQIADQQLQLDELRAVVTQLLIAQNK